jgi:hypothetical protein
MFVEYKTRLVHFIKTQLENARFDPHLHADYNAKLDFDTLMGRLFGSEMYHCYFDGLPLAELTTEEYLRVREQWKRQMEYNIAKWASDVEERAERRRRYDAERAERQARRERGDTTVPDEDSLLVTCAGGAKSYHANDFDYLFGQEAYDRTFAAGLGFPHRWKPEDALLAKYVIPKERERLEYIYKLAIREERVKIQRSPNVFMNLSSGSDDDKLHKACEELIQLYNLADVLGLVHLSDLTARYLATLLPKYRWFEVCPLTEAPEAFDKQPLYFPRARNDLFEAMSGLPVFCSPNLIAERTHSNFTRAQLPFDGETGVLIEGERETRKNEAIFENTTLVAYLDLVEVLVQFKFLQPTARIFPVTRCKPIFDLASEERERLGASKDEFPLFSNSVSVTYEAKTTFEIPALFDFFNSVQKFNAKFLMFFYLLRNELHRIECDTSEPIKDERSWQTVVKHFFPELEDTKPLVHRLSTRNVTTDRLVNFADQFAKHSQSHTHDSSVAELQALWSKKLVIE